MTEILHLPALPLWKGVTTRPGQFKTAPFALVWDERGFLRQSTEEAVLRAVQDAYAEDGYVHMSPPPGASDWASRRGDSHLAFVRRVCPPLAGAKVLEIGAGSLYLAERLTTDDSVGHYVAVDPALDPDQQRPGIEVIRGYFDAETFAGEAFDLVLSFHCLEHIPDPVLFLADLRQSISENGCIVVSVPDVEPFIASGDLNGFIHEHISYFTDTSARRVFSLAGLTVIGVQREAGNLVYALAKGARTALGAIPIPDAGTAGLASRIEASIQHARTVLPAALRQGPLALHGATSGLNSLLFLAFGEQGLTTGGAGLLFDGDSCKTGGYLPLLDVPIRHTSDAEYKSARRVIVCAQSFLAEIRKDLQARHGLDPAIIEPLLPEG
ncbi:class I SAM-dependent methyltransferase [Magnetospirillum aberrantis]|uniref:Class I SAM-dependent methyltransferase n=1 Tax=Magnetospirillum aberrantis SpK TaxID=908842 RepID=A0A7C9QR34_9PROT|nr:class I SAM-dependent methyltransferase [Magnetospirillum aberrantis]NFV78558.1 class I SAM-dependent methyltransferase [Magnetospirillum aberrantis SpK]